MMIVMELVVGTEGQELQRTPAKDIPTMPIKCIPKPKYNPNDKCTDIEWANKRCNFHAD